MDGTDLAAWGAIASMALRWAVVEWRWLKSDERKKRKVKKKSKKPSDAFGAKPLGGGER